VRTAGLRSGASQAAALQRECESLAGQVPGALAGMAGAAGGGTLTPALERMAETGLKRFLDALALYQHVAEGLCQTAQQYDQTEAALAQRASGIGRVVP